MRQPGFIRFISFFFLPNSAACPGLSADEPRTRLRPNPRRYRRDHLGDLHARAKSADVEAAKLEAASRLGAPLRIEMTTAKVGPAILDRAS
jgi:hypothetical protein